jgi:hypothetical protein
MTLAPPSTTSLPPAKYLADALYEALPRLGRAYAHEGHGKNLAYFLQATIVSRADEASLRGILTAVNDELALLEGAQPWQP